MFPIQHQPYRPGNDNLLVLLIGGIPIAMPTVFSVTMAIGSHRLSQQVCSSALMLLFYLMCSKYHNIKQWVWMYFFFVCIGFILA